MALSRITAVGLGDETVGRALVAGDAEGIDPVLRARIADDCAVLDPEARRIYLAARDAAMEAARRGLAGDLSRDLVRMLSGAALGAGLVLGFLGGIPAWISLGLVAAAAAAALGMWGSGPPVMAAASVHALALDVARRASPRECLRPSPAAKGRRLDDGPLFVRRWERLGENYGKAVLVEAEALSCADDRRLC